MIERKTGDVLVNNIPTGLLTGLVEGYDFYYDSTNPNFKGVIISDGKGNKKFLTDKQITWDGTKTNFTTKIDILVGTMTVSASNGVITIK